MRGKKARQLRKNVYGDNAHKTDYVGKLKAVKYNAGKALNEDGTRKKNVAGQKLNIIKRIMMLVPAKGKNKIRVGVLRQAYKSAKKEYHKGVTLHYTQPIME